MAEDRASGGFLGSGITVEAAREAVWSLRQEDNGNGGSAGDVLQSEKSFTATNTGHCLEARLSPPRSASAPRFGLFGMRSGQEGSNSSTLRRNSSASASLNNLALTSTTATSAPLRRTNNWCFDEKLFIQKLYKVYKISIGAACNISWPSHRLVIQVLDDSTALVVKVHLVL